VLIARGGAAHPCVAFRLFAIYDSDLDAAVRKGWNCQPTWCPDESTILRFRHLLEKLTSPAGMQS
jgi:hypothetical protein